ncbi:MAG: hypothetical protein ABJN39_08010 [Sulfitobacter sp.]|uniref:hypothetical protein n=1 Tax=Sulfitobacter sp. TaxID=1903071 RepID=UPI003299C9E6|tara:strand:+ start:251 stop:520 length:270 start_codon:yes stop_codon:yes gene_type:complete
MNADDNVELIFSDLCADVEIDGHVLTVEIYKTYLDPGWLLEVVNAFGTSTVFDEPFISDILAWQQFEMVVKEEGLVAFLTAKEKRRLFH